MIEFKLSLSVLALVLMLTFNIALHVAFAQLTTLSVDITRTNLVWTWAKGAGGDVEKWIFRCGPDSGSYSIMVELPAPTARSIPIAQVVTTPGKYFCTIAASNRFNTSLPSAEVTFEAGRAPGPVSSLKIEAQ